MATLCNRNDCTGCGACLSACNNKAIHFNKDKFGFAYPQIDMTLCVNCKLCEKSCPVINKQKLNFPNSSYACYATDENERLKSSSGGLGTLLAKHFIENNGVVYGCAFVPPMNVKHIRCTTLEDIEKLRGSKYVQSDLSEVLPLLKDDLKEGKEVLFIGTPCQVAGIKSRFNKYLNLTIVDLVCHGVPSLKFLCDTLPDYAFKDNITSLSFRTNNKYNLNIKKNSSILFERPLHKDPFLKGFFTGLLFRPSCYACLYARKERVSDITIADFWKLKSNKIIDDGKGISMALLNTEKGTILFNKIKHLIIYEERPIEEAFEGNDQLRHPFQKNVRESIFKYFYPILGYKISLFIAIPDRLIGTKIKNIFRQQR